MSIKAEVHEACDSRDRDRLVRYMQDALGWKEGTDFTVQTAPAEGDELISCADCGGSFTFSAGEQAYFSKNGLQPPKRCKACRDKRKAEKNRAGGNRPTARRR